MGYEVFAFVTTSPNAEVKPIHRGHAGDPYHRGRTGCLAPGAVEQSQGNATATAGHRRRGKAAQTAATRCTWQREVESI